MTTGFYWLGTMLLFVAFFTKGKVSIGCCAGAALCFLAGLATL